MDALKAIVMSNKCKGAQECKSCPLANSIFLFIGDESPHSIGGKIIMSPCGIIGMLKDSMKQLNED